MGRAEKAMYVFSSRFPVTERASGPFFYTLLSLYDRTLKDEQFTSMDADRVTMP